MAGILSALPAVNATLNTISTIAIAAGVYFIRRGDRARHSLAMWAATGLQASFLAIYLVRVLFSGTTVYQGPPLLRLIYLALLGTHMFLAMVVSPMVVITVWRAWKGRFADHRRIARWTYPIWLYVTATGPVVYLMLKSSY